jgi:hypothetical protein
MGIAYVACLKNGLFVKLYQEISAVSAGVSPHYLNSCLVGHKVNLATPQRDRQAHQRAALFPRADGKVAADILHPLAHVVQSVS